MTQELPKNWTFAEVGEIADLVRGVTYQKSDARGQEAEGFVPLLRANNIKGIVNYDDLVYVPRKKASEEQILRKGDILIAMSSGSKNLVGKAAQVSESFFASFGAFCGVVRAHDSIDERFVGFFFQSKSYRDRVSDLSKGSNINNLKRDHILGTPIPLAPINEQKRIVDRIEQLFSDLDEGEALLKTVQKQLATYRQSVLKAAVTGELIRAKGNKWKEYNVGQLLTDIRYGTAKKCAFDPKKTPVLRIPNVAGGKIDLTDLKHTDFTEAELKKLSLEAGDVLIVRSNGSVSLVGLSAIVTDNAVGFAYAGYLIRLRLKKDIILPEFLNLYLHSPIVRNKIELQARSTSGVHNVNSDEIKAIALNVPSIKEQELIVDKVEEAFSQIAALEDWCIAGLKRSNTLRQSILKSAFSGELVAQDPADEPASELLARIKSGNKQVVKSKQKLKAATSRGGGKPRSDKTEVA